MNFATLLPYLIPLNVFGFVYILTRSDLLRRMVAFLLSAPGMLFEDSFADWLISRRGGVFLHKIWVCTLCQSFHAAWVGVLISACCGAWGWGEAALHVGPLFIVNMLIFKALGSPSSSATPPAPTQDAAAVEVVKWPSPLKPYTSRIVTRATKNVDGHTTVAIEGADEFAQRATELEHKSVPCHFPRCEELRTEFLAVLESLSAGECPKCELGKIKRKYWDIAIALMEEAAAAK